MTPKIIKIVEFTSSGEVVAYRQRKLPPSITIPKDWKAFIIKEAKIEQYKSAYVTFGSRGFLWQR